MIKNYWLFIFFITTPLLSTDLVKELKKHASALDENLLPDSNDYITPRYTNLFTVKRSSFLTDIVKKLFIDYKANFWNPTIFETTLDTVLKNRHDQKLHGTFLQSLVVKPENRIIVFGDLQGAFHSLVRNLEFLMEQKIIDSNLKIQNPGIKIVFTGNIVNRSPYLLETLSTVLLLMQQNPDQVFVIRGKDEKHTDWANELLGIEVAQHYNLKLRKNIIQKLNRFFNSLPLSILCTVNDDKKVLLFTSGGLNPQIVSLGKTQKPKLDVLNLGAIIEGISEKFVYARSSGLILSEPELGAPVWSLSSAPTPVFTKLFDFYYDAFCIIDIKATLTQSTISSLNQDTRTKKGISVTSKYCLVTMSEITKERSSCSTKKPIVVGCTMDLSKGASTQSKIVKQAFSFRTNKKNMDGGINGSPLSIVFLDDEYTPRKAIDNIARFQHDYKTSLIVAPVGSSTLESYLDQIKENKIIALFPFTGAPLFRNKEFKSMVHFRPSYEAEGSALMKHSLLTSPRLKYMVFYQNDAFGKGPLKGATKAFNKYKKNQTLHTVSYERNQVNFSDILPEIRNYNPDVILLSATSVAAIELIRQLGVDYFANRKLLGITDMSETNFKEFMKEKGIPFDYLQVLPPASELNNKMMKPFLTQIGKYNLPYDVYSTEGYIAGSLLIYALEKITPPYTPQKVVQALESVDTNAITGFKLKFNPETRELSNKLWMVTDAGTADEKIKELKSNPLALQVDKSKHDTVGNSAVG